MPVTLREVVIESDDFGISYLLLAFFNKVRYKTNVWAEIEISGKF